jgi:hypothetical protein
LVWLKFSTRTRPPANSSTAGVPNATEGFRRLFASVPFAGQQTTLTWLRSDPVEGNWYRADDSGEEGWLCPALFLYFSTPPQKIYVCAEPKKARLD